MGGVTVLDLTGRMTAGPDDGAVTALRTVVCDLINSGRLHVIMNLSELTSIDARGLGELATAMKTVRMAGGRLTLMGASPQVARMLAITRLDAAFEWCEIEELMA